MIKRLIDIIAFCVSFIHVVFWMLFPFLVMIAFVVIIYFVTHWPA